MQTADPNKLAPLAVYTYTRHEHLIKTVEALRRNHLAPFTVLYVVSDGPKIPEHEPAVRRIRDYVDDLTGFKEVVRVYRENNYGLRRSPPEAEKMILSDHGRIIHMEDDNITSPNFLDFMNAGLQYFENDDSVYSICGYCPPVGPSKTERKGDFWRYAWNMSWGYALWKVKFDHFQPLKNRYLQLRRSGLLAKQNSAGGLYVSDSLKRDHAGLMYFPDAVLCTEMFAANMQSVIPTVSKIQNIGQDGSGQSTKKLTQKYNVILDSGEQRTFDFTQESESASQYRAGARAFFNGSLVTRMARTLGIYHQLSAWREHWTAKEPA